MQQITIEVFCPQCMANGTRSAHAVGVQPTAGADHTLRTTCPHCRTRLKVLYEVTARVRWVQVDGQATPVLAPLAPAGME